MPILSLHQVQPKLVREGYIPIELLEKLVGMELDYRETRRTTYPQMKVDKTTWFQLKPHQLRLKIIEQLPG